MLGALETRLKRLFSTTGGKAVLESLEREAAETEDAMDLRRAAAARVSEARRRDREEKPALEVAHGKAEAAFQEARRKFEEARRTRYEAGTALRLHRERVREDLRRGEGELRRTADPRLREMLDRLYEACANFHHYANRRLHLELHGQFMQAHYVAVNQAEVDAMEARLDTALESVEKWLLVPEPAEEDIVRILAEAESAIGTVTPPDGGGR